MKYHDRSGNKFTLIALAVTFAALASLPFLVPHMGFTALVAFIPLLAMERIATLSGKKQIWPYYYFAFVCWNAMTTFWVCNATFAGGLFAIFANAFQMALIFALFRWFKSKTRGILPYIFLAAAWMAWEHFYFDAAISWPWLVLGNSFAVSPYLVQWYEYTGTLGGSLWIWASNIFLFSIMTALSEGRTARWNIKARIAAFAAGILIIPFPAVLSAIKYSDYTETSDPVNVLALQPNIDPYNKFGGMNQGEQNALLMQLAQNGADSSVTLIVGPETFTSDIYTNSVMDSPTVKSFKDMLEHTMPQCDMIFGASTYTVYPKGERPSYLAVPYGSGWLETHNSALSLCADGTFDLYHKIKLVPGVEGMPYPKIFDPIDRALGGVIGRNVGQSDAQPLECKANARKIGCAICYESVYGEFYSRYVAKGAQLMTIVTNDAWWGDTPGYRQHLRYASLRAIETRRSIVRSANTGISALINQRGDIISSTGWWEKQSLKGTLNYNDRMTFFTLNGDIVGRVSVMIFLLLGTMRLVRGLYKINLKKVR